MSNAVYDRLREGLMRAELAPHQRLKVRDLAREMGTSETPVREALIQLARDGAVEIKPRHYIRVRRLNFDDYRQIRDMRLLLEPMAAERALLRITPAEIDALVGVHEALIAAEEGEDWPVALQTNFDFHFGLYRTSGQRQLIDVLESLWVRIGPTLSALYPDAKPRYAARHQHENIIDALRSRDPFALRLAVQLDLIEGGAQLADRLKQADETAPAAP
nr:GntR family transcriptional regulator [Paracoccus sp. S-4012]